MESIQSMRGIWIIESLQIQRTKNTIVVVFKLKIYNILNAVDRTEGKDK